jgi:proteasome accessory factor A
LADLERDWNAFRKRADWAAKRFALEMVMSSENLDWKDPSLRAYDMEYHNLDPEQGLYHALVEMGEVERDIPDLSDRLIRVRESTRARARSIAVRKFGGSLSTACWRSLTFSGEELILNPSAEYPPELEDTESVEEFVAALRRIE